MVTIDTSLPKNQYLRAPRASYRVGCNSFFAPWLHPLCIQNGIEINSKEYFDICAIFLGMLRAAYKDYKPFRTSETFYFYTTGYLIINSLHKNFVNPHLNDYLTSTIRNNPIFQDYFRVISKGVYFKDSGYYAKSKFMLLPKGIELLEHFFIPFFQEKERIPFELYYTPEKVNSLTNSLSKRPVKKEIRLSYHGKEYTRVTDSNGHWIGSKEHLHHFAIEIAKENGCFARDIYLELKRDHYTYTEEAFHDTREVSPIAARFKMRFSELYDKNVKVKKVKEKKRKISATTRIKINVEKAHKALEDVVSLAVFEQVNNILIHTNRKGFYMVNYSEDETYSRQYERKLGVQNLPKNVRKQLFPDCVELDLRGSAFIHLYQEMVNLIGRDDTDKKFPTLSKCAWNIDTVREQLKKSLEEKTGLTVPKEYVKMCLTATLFGAQVNVQKMSPKRYADLRELMDSDASLKDCAGYYAERYPFFTEPELIDYKKEVAFAAHENTLLMSLESELKEYMKVYTKHRGKKFTTKEGSRKVIYSPRGNMLPLLDENGKRRHIGAKVAFIYQNSERLTLDALVQEIGNGNVGILLHDGIIVNKEFMKGIDITEVERTLEKKRGFLPGLLKYNVKD